MSRRWAKPTPSHPIICAGPARSPIPSPPMNACSASSCSCSSAASTTRSGWPTRRSQNTRPRHSLPDPAGEPFNMDAAIDRIMQTYGLLVNQTADASAEAREKVTEYVKTLFEAGEKDEHRLAVCGLTYLRQLDGSNDPVKAGYTGL